jgi:branched-subunit amino acid aminotransferase/4-amino-4-deoxychorismate lyase
MQGVPQSAPVRIITRRDLESVPAARASDYFAMYSSVWNGIVVDPSLMLVPVHDHLVHRGDGVFETLKCLKGSVYCLEAHLDRLFFSANMIGLQPAWSRDQLRDILIQTTRAGGQRDCLLRVLLSRGPGGMGVNPYECPSPGLYVLAYALRPSPMESHPGGVTAASSRISLKPGFFANIKSCNYLSNVLMKKEAVDGGVDFTLSFDEQGFLAEGATENAAIVSSGNVLKFPLRGRILAGTTVSRAMALGGSLVSRNVLAGIAEVNIPIEEVRAARELLLFGTTPDVTAVIRFDGQPVGLGEPGPVQRELSALLLRDLRENGALLTPAFL